MIIAITGHRPEDTKGEQHVRDVFRSNLLQARPEAVITGISAGVDLWAADEARLLGIEIWAARPWSTHTPRTGDEELYGDILAAASKVVTVTSIDRYPGPWVYHKRNEWMVDHADNVLAYWNSKESGGTYACINYAKKVMVPVRNVY